MPVKSGKENVRRIRNNENIEKSRQKTIRQPFSAQQLLNRLLAGGIVGIVGAVAFCLPIVKMNWSEGWWALPVVLALAGLVLLVSAWHVRQGLLHGRLMKFMIKLMNAFRK